MNIYEITNTTHLLGKRDINYNTTLKVEYIDEMVKKTIGLKPQQTLYLSVKSLPVSLIKYRIKGLIHVVEINNKQLKNKINHDNLLKKSKYGVKEKNNATTTTTTTKKQTTKSTSTKKTSSKTSNKSTKNTTEKTIDIVKDDE